MRQTKWDAAMHGYSLMSMSTESDRIWAEGGHFLLPLIFTISAAKAMSIIQN